MSMLTYYGQSTFALETSDGVRIVIDPWFTDNPMTNVGPDELGNVDYIFCTHGHFDHFADAIPLAKRTGAQLVGTFEVVSFAQTQGVENVQPLHIGGGFTFPFGYVKMTPALHGGVIAGDENGRFTSFPGGFLFNLADCRLYHAGDTALTMDMQLLHGKVDVALLPIGDAVTMGPDDAATAVEFIAPSRVVPIHYNTWPFIEQDPEEFRRKVGGRATVEVLKPGDELELG